MPALVKTSQSGAERRYAIQITATRGTIRALAEALGTSEAMAKAWLLETPADCVARGGSGSDVFWGMQAKGRGSSRALEAYGSWENAVRMLEDGPR